MFQWRVGVGGCALPGTPYPSARESQLRHCQGEKYYTFHPLDLDYIFTKLRGCLLFEDRVYAAPETPKQREGTAEVANILLPSSFPRFSSESLSSKALCRPAFPTPVLRVTCSSLCPCTKGRGWNLTEGGSRAYPLRPEATDSPSQSANCSLTQQPLGKAFWTEIKISRILRIAKAESSLVWMFGKLACI